MGFYGDAQAHDPDQGTRPTPQSKSDPVGQLRPTTSPPHPRTSQPPNRHRQAQGIRSRVLAEALGMPVAFFDVVSLHAPEPPAMQGMISAVQIAHMKPSHQRLARHRDATGRAGQPNLTWGRAVRGVVADDATKPSSAGTALLNGTEHQCAVSCLELPLARDTPAGGAKAFKPGSVLFARG